MHVHKVMKRVIQIVAIAILLIVICVVELFSYMERNPFYFDSVQDFNNGEYTLQYSGSEYSDKEEKLTLYQTYEVTDGTESTAILLDVHNYVDCNTHLLATCEYSSYVVIGYDGEGIIYRTTKFNKFLLWVKKNLPEYLNEASELKI